MRDKLRTSFRLLLAAGFATAITPLAQANSETTLGFENDFYRDVVHPQAFPFVKLGYDFNSNRSSGSDETSNDAYEWKGDILLRMSPSHPKAWALSSQNCYWGEKDQSYETPLRFTFGRRLIGWSHFDELWGLNEFEPLDSWDRLRPFTSGLTGAFAYTETQKFNFRFFLSYVYAPAMAPNVVLNNQKFAAEHPQAISTAPESFNFLNQATPIGYTLQIPSIDKIIFRPSFAFMMETKRELPVHAKFSYGYLPLNYFPVAIKGILQLPGTVPATIVPRLLHHHLYNAEASYTAMDSVEVGANFLIDQPVPEAIPSDYTTTPFTTQTLFSPWFQFQTATWKFTFSQIWTRDGLGTDVGSLALPDRARFSSQIFYRNASLISWKASLNSSSVHQPELLLKVIHEYSIRGDWMSGDFFYHFNPKFSGYVGGDLLSSYADVSPDRGAEFLADLRAFGRVRLGVNYVL